ncbi:MAG: monofunctional biosynthetic peptidoglycan transglycosylase [Bacteroidetes bacterium SW_9_63_38]|nr:MAG: monofunctional biosynthetic peptidoglycan transglycosylase [Bacteroidetes bacterium SW_9_63_38]
MTAPPPRPGAYGQPSPQQSSWTTVVRTGCRKGIAVIVATIATYLGICVLALVLYAAIFPPITGVQLQRRVEALFNENPYRTTYCPRPLRALDADLPRAVVAAEDRRFFRHSGIDWTAVGDAIEEYRRGGDLRGASSISQQLVKNLFLTTHRSIIRKGLEVPLTYAAELVLSKRRILELYVNIIEWGPGIYGAEAAAQHHYEHSARRLTRNQAAALTACIPNPRERRPSTVGGYKYVILRRMHNLGPFPLSPLGALPFRTVPENNSAFSLEAHAAYGTIHVPSKAAASASYVNRAR